MAKTRIGIIGLGGISQLVHLPILSNMNNVEIAAVSDIDKNKLEVISHKFRIGEAYPDYHELLRREDIGAVIVATPTNTHHEIVIESLKNGKHVLVEKPAAINYGKLVDMAEVGKVSGLSLMVGMNLRFRPDAMLLKSLINSGELGEIFYVKSGWLRRQSSSQKWFLQKEKAGGGALTDLGLLLVDLSLWLLDYPEINTVSVQSYSHLSQNVEDSAVGLIRCRKEAAINFDVSWSMSSEEDTFGLSVFGTEGTAKLNPFRAFKKIGAEHIDLTTPSSSRKTDNFKKSYANELKHFIACVRSGAQHISGIDEAVKLMKLLEIMYKSAESEREISLGKG